MKIDISTPRHPLCSAPLVPQQIVKQQIVWEAFFGNALKNMCQTLHMMSIPALMIISIVVCCISGLSAEEFYVDDNSQSSNHTGSFDDPFYSIAEAVNHIIISGPLQDDFADIIIKPGSYDENIIIPNPGANDTISWRFRAYEDNVTIKGNSSQGPIFACQALSGTSLCFQNLDFTTNYHQSNVAFRVTSGNYIDNLKFSNCTFSGFAAGILITEEANSEVPTQVNNFEVEGCHFEGIPHGGGGIVTCARCDMIYGDVYTFVANITIHNNTFSDNNIALVHAPEHLYECISIQNLRKNASAYEQIRIYENSFECDTFCVYPYGVALDRLNRHYYLYSQRSYKALIYENTFINHRIASGFSKLKLTKNKAKITDTGLGSFIAFIYEEEDVLDVPADTLWTERNIVYAPHAYTLKKAVLYDKNNSFFGNGDFMRTIQSGGSIENSIASGYNDYFSLGGGIVRTKNCYFDTQIFNPLVQYEDCIFGIDPLISHHSATLDYNLNWDYDQRSPLINAGCPEIDGEPQYDPDGTPPDIGAVYYPHHSRTYFSGVSPSNIYWMSFPVVDDRTNTNGDDYWNELGQMFSEYMLYAPNSILNHISWSYDVIASTMQYDLDHSVWGDTYHPVTQPKGYKVQFASGIHPDELTINGFKANPNT
ncbi:MAG: hypothetical protein PHE66_09295, partial [Syntrophaceticus schinkii]|nr:hypothetical protein [Syntrophaceticus schinkii]